MTSGYRQSNTAGDSILGLGDAGARVRSARRYGNDGVDLASHSAHEEHVPGTCRKFHSFGVHAEQSLVENTEELNS